MVHSAFTIYHVQALSRSLGDTYAKTQGPEKSFLMTKIFTEHQIYDSNSLIYKKITKELFLVNVYFTKVISILLRILTIWIDDIWSWEQSSDLWESTYSNPNNVSPSENFLYFALLQPGCGSFAMWLLVPGDQVSSGQDIKAFLGLDRHQAASLSMQWPSTSSLPLISDSLSFLTVVWL